MIQRKTNKHNSLENLSVQIFADGADLDGIAHLYRNPRCRSFTTRIRDRNFYKNIPLIKELALEGVKLNITAIFTLAQVRDVTNALNPAVASVVSVFAGRIADTGGDPNPVMRAAKALLEHLPKAELLWASVREVLNIFEADECGCHMVTVPHDILNKALKLTGMDLETLSLDTVRMFAKDAEAAGYSL